MLTSSNGFNPTLSSPCLLSRTISMFSVSNCVVGPGTTVRLWKKPGSSWQAGSVSEVRAEGSCRANRLSLMNDSYSPPPLNITWALRPTQHSAAQYHNVSSDTVEVVGREGREGGREGDGDNLRCDLEDGDCPLATKILCKKKDTCFDTLRRHGATKAAILGLNLKKKVVLCHAAASRAPLASGKRKTCYSFFL